MNKNHIFKQLKAFSDLGGILDSPHQETFREKLETLKQGVVDLAEANEILEGYNRSLSAKMVERTEELQSLLDKLKEEQAFQVSYNSLVTSLNSSVELHNLLKDALRGMLKFSQSQVGVFYLFDVATQTLNAREWIGVTLKKKNFLLGEGLPGQAAEERKNLVLSDIPKDASLHLESGMFSSPPTSIGYFPILYRDELLGVFELGSIQIYREKLLKHLESAQVQVAISIHNAILYQKSQEMAQKFKATSEKLTEKNQALEIQQRLLAEQKQELDYKNRELKAASEQKSNFLTTMSHELRTPLNSIIGYTDLALKKAGDSLGTHRKKLEKVLNNGQHLLSLINNILDLSKIEAGKMELFVEEFDLSKLIHNCISTAQGLVEGKPIKLIEDVQPGLPKLKTDQSKLKQVFINLLGNSAKFTEEGSITLSAKLHNSSPSWLRISVRDTGPGIPEEKLSSLFDSFTQADGSATRRHGGTGLGLAIVKKMTQLMHGKVFLESKVGEGSIFYLDIPIDVYNHIMGGGAMGEGDGMEQQISLSSSEKPFVLPGEAGSRNLPPAPAPLAAPRPVIPSGQDSLGPVVAEKAPLKAAPSAAPAPPVSLEIPEEEEELISVKAMGKKNILVVDDDAVVHELFAHFLEETPYFPLLAEDSDQALKMALKYKPAVIFLDIILKNSNGWELLQAIKGDPQISSIPVVVSSNIDNTFLAENLGASGFLSKPVSRDDLFDLLEQFGDSQEALPTLLLLSSPGSPFLAKVQEDLPSFLSLEVIGDIEKALPLFNKPNLLAIAVDLLHSPQDILNRFDELVMNLPVLEPPVITLVDPEMEPQPALPELSDHVLSLYSNYVDLTSFQQILAGLWKGSSPLFPEEVSSSRSSSPSGKKKILVVEDVPDNLEFVCDVLGDEYEMVCARDGKEGVDKALESKPHLILMDLLLPNIDGLEATKMIRDNPETSHIPIIALTAHAMVGDREKALKSGCVDYLTKPIVEDVLKNRVREVLKEK